MVSAGDFRNGVTFEMEGNVYQIIEFQHVKPGKGGAFVRTKLRNMKTGRVIPNTFNAGVKINEQRVERRPFQFLYKDDNGYNFMHAQTFEQISIQEDIISAPQFLMEGQEVEIVIHEDSETPLSCELPAFVELLITYTEPGLKGDTATNTLKHATVETGAIVDVPLFIESGERIKVDTRTGNYSERVKK